VFTNVFQRNEKKSVEREEKKRKIKRQKNPAKNLKYKNKIIFEKFPKKMHIFSTTAC
jgi:hypothetical protein